MLRGMRLGMWGFCGRWLLDKLQDVQTDGCFFRVGLLVWLLFRRDGFSSRHHERGALLIWWIRLDWVIELVGP
jgi:hypothetical protein